MKLILLISAIVSTAVNVPSANCFTFLRKLQDGAYLRYVLFFWRNGTQ